MRSDCGLNCLREGAEHPSTRGHELKRANLEDVSEFDKFDADLHDMSEEENGDPAASVGPPTRKQRRCDLPKKSLLKRFRLGRRRQVRRQQLTGYGWQVLAVLHAIGEDGTGHPRSDIFTLLSSCARAVVARADGVVGGVTRTDGRGLGS